MGQEKVDRWVWPRTDAIKVGLFCRVYSTLSLQIFFFIFYHEKKKREILFTEQNLTDETIQSKNEGRTFKQNTRT